MGNPWILREWENKALKRYHNVHDQVRATVTLAEVEMDLERTDEGERHLVKAQKILDRLVLYIATNHLEDSVPKTTDLEVRIKNDLGRLQGRGIANSRSSLDSRPTFGRTG